jgi:hypothetical protein
MNFDKGYRQKREFSVGKIADWKMGFSEWVSGVMLRTFSGTSGKAIDSKSQGSSWTNLHQYHF